jgi:uncharacterized protein (TIGR03067 family)
MTRLLPILLTVILQTPDTRPDLIKIQGKWRLESLVDNGEKKVRNLEITIDGNELTNAFNGRTAITRKIKLDETKAPKTWDLIVSGGEFFGAIYKLEGDTLTVCYADRVSKPRPTEFESKPGGRTSLSIFKRVAK